MNLDKLIDIQFISKQQLINVIYVDSVSQFNSCVLPERLSLLDMFVSFNAHRSVKHANVAVTYTLPYSDVCRYAELHCHARQSSVDEMTNMVGP
jgi:hypothetical protein